MSEGFKNLFLIAPWVFFLHFIFTNLVSQNSSASARVFWRKKKPFSCMVKTGPN
jgi:hypothetical protein